MIGEIVFELQAENSTRLPFINGRFMHAAFFKILNETSPAFGSFVHDKLNIKPFTVSFLDPVESLAHFEERWIVRRGDKFLWRVTALNEEILNAALKVPVGYKVQSGSLTLRVTRHVSKKITSVDDLISSVKNLPPVKEITFNFVSPVTFKIDDFDAPYPRAELIFASLADKWTQAEMPAEAEKKIVRELAARFRLTEWQGQAKKFFLAQDRGTLAFWGKFLYNAENPDADIAKVFVLLAKFAEFSGVGRLTGQGFGQTRVDFSTG